VTDNREKMTTISFESISTAITRRKPLTPASTPKQSPKVLRRGGNNSGNGEDASIGVNGLEEASSSLKRTLGVMDLIFPWLGSVPRQQVPPSL